MLFNSPLALSWCLIAITLALITLPAGTAYPGRRGDDDRRLSGHSALAFLRYSTQEDLGSDGLREDNAQKAAIV